MTTQSDSRFPARAHNCAKVEPIWKVKHTVGEHVNNMVPHSLYNKVCDEGVETTKALVAAESEIARLKAEISKAERRGYEAGFNEGQRGD